MELFLLVPTSRLGTSLRKSLQRPFGEKEGRRRMLRSRGGGARERRVLFAVSPFHRAVEARARGRIEQQRRRQRSVGKFIIWHFPSRFQTCIVQKLENSILFPPPVHPSSLVFSSFCRGGAIMLLMKLTPFLGWVRTWRRHVECEAAMRFLFSIGLWIRECMLHPTPPPPLFPRFGICIFV